MTSERNGLVFGLIGVLGFSMTLPATRVAVSDLDGTFVGLGRALVAATLAAALLLWRRERRPTRAELGPLLLVAAGATVGFPLLSAWALHDLPASHSAVVLALLPMATAVMAVLRGGERPSGTFWVVAALGVGVVLLFAASMGGGAPQPGDLLLLAAVVAAAISYAEGGRLARTMGGWQVISWALVIAAPFLVLPVVASAIAHPVHARPEAWLGFAYVSVVSMFLAFVAWYRGLAAGGIARVGQLQLVQPVLTLLWSVLLLGEVVGPLTVIAALAVVATVAVGRRAARVAASRDGPEMSVDGAAPAG